MMSVPLPAAQPPVGASVLALVIASRRLQPDVKGSSVVVLTCIVLAAALGASPSPSAGPTNLNHDLNVTTTPIPDSTSPRTVSPEILTVSPVRHAPYQT